jgi:hypothetical protein
LFNQFIKILEDNNLLFNEGKLIDASFTIAPRQRNTREENEKIKKGEGNDLWKDQPNKKSLRILMPDGQRKTGRNITAIKIMQRLIPRVNS